jgi:AraC-like DNA-binding protein
VDASSQEWVVHAPAAQLRPFVDRYVGYRLTGFPPGLHRGLPSPHMTFIVSVGPSIDVVSQTDPLQSPASYGCVVSGLQASPAVIAHTGNQEGVAIELSPLGSRTLFAMPAAELWDLSVELSAVVGPAGAELWERLQVAPSWEERFSHCDDILLRLASKNEIAPELRHCWTTLVGSGGKTSVGDLASEVGYSRPHLARRFRNEFGLTPKLAARVVRFDRARRMLQAMPSFASIACVAASCGYYDQAHLYRDFAELAGCTPMGLLREEVPFFQDDALLVES